MKLNNKQKLVLEETALYSVGIVIGFLIHPVAGMLMTVLYILIMIFILMD